MLVKVLTLTAKSENELDERINNTIEFNNSHGYEVEVGNLVVYSTSVGYSVSNHFTVMLKIYQ